MKRILVIRGGAIGDFMLTLPALKLLRDGFPEARIEILGYKHIIALAENRFYAQATRSIEYGPLASFFSKQAELPTELADYFAGFDLIVSYLFDPDQIFEANVRRCGVDNFIFADPKIQGSEHAARQLARPLEQLGLKLMKPVAELYPSETDRRAARDLVGMASSSITALHPGSGSATKNWPIENWIALGDELLSRESTKTEIVVVGGEADEIQVRKLESVWKNREVFFAKNLPLPVLAALLERSLFIGHDSGISHVAAAAGARCVLLFGPTDPAIWAPANESVTVLQAPEGDLRLLTVDEVIKTIES
jgi:ADP-heptose:LPS heptosyltransferase